MTDNYKLNDLKVKSIKKIETEKEEDTTIGYTTILTGEGTMVTIATKNKPSELVVGEDSILTIEHVQSKLE